MIKLILWAAQKEPQIQIQDVPKTVVIKPGTRTPTELKITVPELDKKKSYQIALEIRSTNPLFRIPKSSMSRLGLHNTESLLNTIFHQKQTIINEDNIRFPLPPLPDGEYFIDLFLLCNDMKLDWATIHLAVESPVIISEIKMDPPYLDLTQDRNPTLNLTALYNDTLPDNGTLRLSLIDNNDRLVNDAAIKITKGDTQTHFQFETPFISSTLLKVRAELTLGETKTDIAVTRLTVVRREWNRFAFVGWAHAGPSSRQQRVLARVLAGLGFDAQRGRPGSFERLDVADILAFPAAGGKRIGKIDIDSEVLNKEFAKTQATAMQNRPFDPFGYVTSDEVSYGGGEDLPSRVHEFQKQLKRIYGSIGALNTQWGSDFETFEQVPAITKKTAEPLMAKARKTLNFSPIVDQYLENCRVYAAHFAFYQKALNTIDPHARFGIESPLWPWASRHLDWYAILQGIRFFSPYGREGDLQTYEFARSFARPGTALGMTYGGYIYNGFVRKPEPMDLEFQRWRPWNALLRGFNTIYWYNLGPVIESGVGMGLQPYPALLTAVEQIDQIRKGYYTLIRSAQPAQDPIAIHYSMTSNIISEQIRDFGQLPWNVHMLLRILQDYAPAEYKFLATPQIEAGGLKDYKAFIMPLSQTVTKNEAIAIGQFVKSGGLVVADVRPGIFDGHGKFGGNPVVQEIFGIAHKKTLGRKNAAIPTHGDAPDSWFGDESISIPVDPSLTLTGAQPVLVVDGVPIVTVNPVGKGAAVCLNIPFNNYQRYPTPDSLYFYLADPAHATMVGKILRTVFSAYNVNRTLQVKTPRKAWPMGLETWLFKQDGVAYIGLTKRRMKNVEAQSPVRIVSPVFGHVYDMITGEYFGEKKTWAIGLNPADVRLFSVMPYMVQSIDASCRSDRIHRGNNISGQIRVNHSGEKSVRHVVNLHVIRPDGKPVPYLGHNLETQGGSAEFVVPIALNDPLGKYHLIFTDVATQVKKLVTIEVI